MSRCGGTGMVNGSLACPGCPDCEPKRGGEAKPGLCPDHKFRNYGDCPHCTIAALRKQLDEARRERGEMRQALDKTQELLKAYKSQKNRTISEAHAAMDAHKATVTRMREAGKEARDYMVRWCGVTQDGPIITNLDAALRGGGEDADR